MSTQSALAPCLALALASAPLAQEAQAATAQDDGTGWRASYAIYPWAIRLDGTIAIDGQEAEIERGFGDLLEDLDLGGMAGMRAENQRWSATLDLVAIDLGQEFEKPASEVDFEAWIVELDGARKLAGGFEVFLGARYVSLEAGIDFEGPLGASLERGEAWIDPVVGARWERRLSESWSFVGRADVGGFGVGSDLTWQATALFGLDLGSRWTGFLGYRALDIEIEEGSDSDGVEFDMLVAGPILGFRFAP